MINKVKQLLANERGQMGGMDLPGAMILLVVAVVIGFVGLQVMSTIIETTALTGNNSDPNVTNDPLYNASDSLQTSINDAWGLVGVAFIVVILAVVIVYLYGLRGGRR